MNKTDEQQIKDLLLENRQYFAKSYNLQALIKLKGRELYECINKVASLMDSDEGLYMQQCKIMNQKLFELVKYVHQRQEARALIRENLNTIRLLRYGINKETN